MTFKDFLELFGKAIEKIESETDKKNIVAGLDLPSFRSGLASPTLTSPTSPELLSPTQQFSPTTDSESFASEFKHPFAPAALTEDVELADDFCLTELGAKNLKEYFAVINSYITKLLEEQLAAGSPDLKTNPSKSASSVKPEQKDKLVVGVLNPTLTHLYSCQEGLAALKKKYDGQPKLLNSRQIFHRFLFELHRLEAEKSSQDDNLEEYELSGDDLEKLQSKKPGQVMPEVLRRFGDMFLVEKQKAATKHDAEERFKDDEIVELEAGGAQVFIAETIGVWPQRQQNEDRRKVRLARKDGDWAHQERIPFLLKRESMAIGGEIRKSQEAAVARNKQRALRREKEMEKIPGSTSLITYCSKDRKLTIAVKGDSRAVLVCVKENNDVEMIRLTNDQRPDNPLEKFRIESEGGVVVNSRVNGNSAVARSDGDSWVEGRTGQKLISSEPEIYSYDVAKIAKAKNAKQVFLISSCDAFYENKANENKYKAPLKRWFNDRLLQARWGGNIAAYLKDFAVGICETHDNTTDIVADLSNDLKEAIVTELYDGHLGKEIAEFLVTNFGPRLGLEEGVHEISRKKEEVLMPEVELMRQNSGAVTVILKDGEDQDRKRPQQARHNRANPSFDFGSDFGVDSAYGEDKSSDSDGKSGDLDRDDEQPRVSVSLSAQSMPPASAPSRAAPASNSASAPARNPQNASAAPVRATGPCCVIL